MPDQKLADAILAEWRAIERQLDALGPDAAAYEGAKAEANRLRLEYQRLMDDAIAHHRPCPRRFRNQSRKSSSPRAARTWVFRDQRGPSGPARFHVELDKP